MDPRPDQPRQFPDFHPALTLPHPGGGQWLGRGYFFFAFLGAGASALHMTPASLQAGHFLGLQRVSTFSPHFSQVKTAMTESSRFSMRFIQKPLKLKRFFKSPFEKRGFRGI
jgi:hypothetical protein